jgi:hypothetical protein
MNMSSLYRTHRNVYPTRNYRIMVHWHDGRVTCEADSDNPDDVRGAPMVARNARSIKRIELHDRSGVLATIWASHWVGYQTSDREPAA